MRIVDPLDIALPWGSANLPREDPPQLHSDASQVFVLERAPAQRFDNNPRALGWVDRYTGHPPGAHRTRVDSLKAEFVFDRVDERHGIVGAQHGTLRTHPDDPSAADEFVTTAYGGPNGHTGAQMTTNSPRMDLLDGPHGPELPTTVTGLLTFHHAPNGESHVHFDGCATRQVSRA